ncbi:MAG TPA: nucleoside-diphosphate kinase [Nitrososphaerales archaeon]|nr:nucleoside-diphosphate kinase [Nitrososphaerales archaeon]
MAEQTLIILKPDSVKKNSVGEILRRFEEKGFVIKKLMMLTMDKNKAEQFYSVHSTKPFFSELVSFITSGPVVAAVIEGSDAVNKVRAIIGATRPNEAAPATVRRDFGTSVTQNVIHASDSVESFIKESKIIFG